MVLAIDTVPPEVSSSLPSEVHVPNDTNPDEDVLYLLSQNTEKKSRLE